MPEPRIGAPRPRSGATPPTPLRRLLDRLSQETARGGRDALCRVERMEAQEARTGAFPLPAEVGGILSRRGISELWTHQSEALRAWRSGDDVLLTTRTASGKSLVYNLAVALAGLEDPASRSLFLFPLKALERDQLRSLRADLSSLEVEERPEAAIYDGDTSPQRRKKLRERPPTVLLTTPDMLHMGILPAHGSWKRFFEHLRLIVIDEVHTYRGVLGSHAAQVLRRLLRVAHHYGARPQVIGCSATIGNPEGFLDQLTGRSARVVRDDGAPAPLRHFGFVEPGASTYSTAARLFRRCVSEGLRTIAFTQARRITELMHTWVIEAQPELAARIASYRSGYLPEERREIERRLFDGDLVGVISTSALELGIDVGGLDVCILVGFPGSVLATRQRAGRVARSREGLIFLVPQQDALDRFFLKHPGALLNRGCEDAVLDPASPEILAAHLPCAAAEIPLRRDDSWLREPGVGEALERACRGGQLLESAAGGEWFAARRSPAREISLRSVGESFAIRRVAGGDARRAAIGTIGRSRVLDECHPGAIYLHRARPYRVQHLDLERREVEVQGPVRVDYYTRAVGEKETEILEVLASRPLGNALLRVGRLRVTSRLTHYEKRRTFGQDLLGVHPLELPPTVVETVGVWLELAPEIERAVSDEGGHFMGGIHGLEHAALALFPLYALCDRFDVAGISVTRHPQVRGPAVFMYDGPPGGIGISRAMFPRMEQLLEATLEVVESCECEEGCPSCIHSPRCGSGNRPLDKRATLRALRLTLGHEALPEVEVEAIDLEPLPLPIAAASEAPKPLMFDLETQRSAEEVGGWHNTHLMRLALAVVYDAATGRFETYTEDRASELIERLRKAPLVLGFNIRRFDYAVLSAYAPYPLVDVPTFDLLEDIHSRLGRRVSLGHLAETTLGHGKSGDGLQSLEWFRNGEIERVEKYCRMDVELVRDLVAYGEREGYVLLETRDCEAVRLPVAWDVDSMMASARATLGGSGRPRA